MQFVCVTAIVCVYLYVCERVCRFVVVYVCIDVDVCVCEFVCACCVWMCGVSRLSKCINVREYMSMRVFVCVCVYTWVLMCVRACVHVCIQVFIFLVVCVYKVQYI